MQDKNQDNKSGLSAGQSSAATNAPRNQSRRQFALAGSAVLLTVASRPVLATGQVCNSPSGFISGNVSQHGTPNYCAGRTPGYWMTKMHWAEWPSPYYTCGTLKDGTTCNKWDDWNNDGTTFKDQFSCSGLNWNNYANYGTEQHPKYYSMMQVLWMTGSQDPAQLGAHIVAALLNAKKGWTTGVLTEQGVKDIWNEYNSKGYYEPTATVKWYPADIVAYLQSTMPL